MITRKTPRPKALWVQIRGERIKKRRKPIASRTAKMRRVLRIYQRMRSEFLMTNLECAKFKEKPSSQIHHRRGRIGTLLIDRRFWVAVSAEAHLWIGNHPKEAREQGLLCAEGEWNRAPKDEETERLKALINGL